MLGTGLRSGFVLRKLLKRFDFADFSLTAVSILSNADSDFLKSLSARVILIDFGHVAKIFKRPKNREDSSDFDDFWTELIVMT